ncbi:MAG: protein-methionine-sulfoxide reductase catalytic subunit MsrP, partial [Rhodobacteraceae bacterium]|nr:protein-methionine-sulfoxide reductase catalytic subunit MsrP [Paracoccaceae bacterium]
MRRQTRPLTWADVTPEADFINRRALLAGAGAFGIGALAAGRGRAATDSYSTDEAPNSFQDISTFNNYYEFGFDKGDPASYAHVLTTEPWPVQVDGLVDRPGTYDLGDLLEGLTVHERIYRFRCVEAWSMIVPWQGVELAALLKKIGVQSGARYVAFETLYRPKEMRGQRSSVLVWPYREGLRLDEAMHPLTLLATGLYGKPLPKQNGAPLRLVVPWK